MPLVPTAWQQRVLALPADLNLLLAGGRGAGRTTCALLLALQHAKNYGSRARVLFVRGHLRSLAEVEDSLQLLVPNGKLNRQDHLMRLPGGATIEFGPLSEPADLAKLQGRSFSLIIADEYGTFSAQQMKMVDALRANLRAGDVPTRLILLANPAGRGHGTIVKRFINHCVAWREKTLEDGTRWVFAPASFKDNPNLPASYAADLFAACGRDEELYKGWSEGSWAIARGAVLADVIDQTRQMLSRQMVAPIAAHSRAFKFLACDWGTSAPSVCYLGARLLVPLGPYPRGSLVLIDETHTAEVDDLSVGRGFSPGRLADDINAMCDRWEVPNRSGVIDDARGLGTDETLIKTMARFGLYFTRPTKGRAEGLATMRELLFNSMQRNQRPGLWVSSDCAGWWETVPVLPRDPRRPDVPDTSANDHFYDASVYAATHRVMEARFNNSAATAARYPQAAGPLAPTIY